MAAYIERRKLDLTKSTAVTALTDPIYLRQGETAATQIIAEIYDDGQPFSVRGWNVRFRCYNAAGDVVDSQVVIDSDTSVSFVVTSDITAEPGNIKLAYFHLRDGVTTLTTASMPIIVLPNVDMTAEQADEYKSQIDRYLDELNEALMKAEGVSEKVDEALATVDEMVKRVTESMENYDCLTDAEVAYAVSPSGTEVPGDDQWQEERPVAVKGAYLWSRITLTFLRLPTRTVYTVAYQGEDGLAVQQVDVEYAVSESPTEAPEEGWSTDSPTWVEGQFIWYRNVICYSGGRTEVSQPVCISGSKGVDGVGISEVIEEYYVSDSRETPTGGNWSTEAPKTTPEGKYVWTRTTFVYSDGNRTQTAAICNTGAPGKDGIDGTGVSITGIVEWYAISSSDVSYPAKGSNSWHRNEVPTPTGVQPYLWNYEEVTCSDGKVYSSPPAVITRYVTDGQDGNDGRGISSISEWYLATNIDYGVTPDYMKSSWTQAPQDIGPDKRFLWNYESISYTDGSTQRTAPAIICIYPEPGEQGPPGAPGKDGKDGAPGESGDMWVGTSSSQGSIVSKVSNDVKAQRSGTRLTQLTNGTVVAITFTTPNSAAAPTLNVNGTGAYPIITSGNNAAYWSGSNVCIVFRFDNTSYINGRYGNWLCCSTPIYTSEEYVGNPKSSHMHLLPTELEIVCGLNDSVKLGDNEFLFNGTRRSPDCLGCWRGTGSLNPASDANMSKVYLRDFSPEAVRAGIDNSDLTRNAFSLSGGDVRMNYDGYISVDASAYFGMGTSEEENCGVYLWVKRKGKAAWEEIGSAYSKIWHNGAVSMAGCVLGVAQGDMLEMRVRCGGQNGWGCHLENKATYITVRML